MRILAVAHAVPSERITNDWIVEQIRAHSAAALSRSELDLLECHLRTFLAAAGTNVRYRLADGEKGIDLALAAARRAFDAAGVTAGEIDFIIYAGVARGWLEPATAAVFQGELGCVSATAFDVLEACASWLRALQVAHAFIRAGVYRCGLIVNCETGFAHYGELTVERLEDLEHCFATCTIGEAATATIVTESSTDDFHFVFRSFGEHAKLCMIPLPTVAGFLPGEMDPELRTRKFFSRSRELLGVTTRRVVEVFQSDPVLSDPSFDVCFGHAASEKAVRVIAKKLDLPYERYFSTHATHGNTVAASLPLGMSLAVEQGLLRRGHKVLLVVGASGITVGCARFSY
jgi:3-oxoacyl-[acyl-carrier-protein] synthase III